MADEPISVTVSSGYGANTGQPYVQIVIKAADWMTQMTPQTARELAFNLLTAADAADSDGFIFGFMYNVVGAPAEDAAAVLISFREYRESLQEKSDGHSND